MKKIILTPNPYRDKNFNTVRTAKSVLETNGVEVKLCLPFEVDRSYDLPRDLRFSKLDRELLNTDAVICFGGDGTILHMAKTATRHGIPILGVNIGTMGFISLRATLGIFCIKNWANLFGGLHLGVKVEFLDYNSSDFLSI